MIFHSFVKFADSDMQIYHGAPEFNSPMVSCRFPKKTHPLNPDAPPWKPGSIAGSKTLPGRCLGPRPFSTTCCDLPPFTAYLGLPTLWAAGVEQLAFWLWSSVVSVLISVTTNMSPTGDLLVTSIFAGEVSSRACSGALIYSLYAYVPRLQCCGWTRTGGSAGWFIWWFHVPCLHLFDTKFLFIQHWWTINNPRTSSEAT